MSALLGFIFIAAMLTAVGGYVADKVSAGWRKLRARREARA